VIFATLMFLFIYNLVFFISPVLSTARIVLFIMLMVFGGVAVRNTSRINPLAFLFIFVATIALLWALLLYLESGCVDSTQLSRQFHFIVYSMLGSFLFSAAADWDRRKILVWFVLAVSAQSLFIYVSYFYEPFRVLVTGLLVQGGHIPIESGRRVAGLSNSSGALLSLIQAIGMLASLELSRNDRRRSMKWLSCGAFILGTTILTGRTGLALGFMFFVVYLFWFLLNNRTKRAVQSILLFCLVPGLIVAASMAWGGAVNNTFYWAFEFLLTGNVHSVESLLKMPIPALSQRTILGTGLVVGENGNASGHDSGYIQTYFALGLPIAAVFYVSMFAFVLGHLRKYSRDLVVWVALAGIVVAEMKEPFIFKYIYPFFLFTLLFSRHFDRRQI